MVEYPNKKQTTGFDKSIVEGILNIKTTNIVALKYFEDIPNMNQNIIMYYRKMIIMSF